MLKLCRFKTVCGLNMLCPTAPLCRWSRVKMEENAPSHSTISRVRAQRNTLGRPVKHVCGVSVVPVSTAAIVWTSLMDTNVRTSASCYNCA